MLPVKLKPRGFDQRDKETWESYCSRLSLTQDEAQREFYRQVVYDHFDHFNDLYPGFELDQYRPLISEMTASVAQARIRYFDNVRMTNRMLERELISPDSSHKFVILTSKTCISG